MMLEFMRILGVMTLVGAIIYTLDDATTNGDELTQEQSLYCEMVQIHKESNGNYGWPDFKGIAEEVCK